MHIQNGTLLLSQIFSEEPVQQIRCRTYEPPRHTADAEKVCLLLILMELNQSVTLKHTELLTKLGQHYFER